MAIERWQADLRAAAGHPLLGILGFSLENKKLLSRDERNFKHRNWLTD